MGRHFGWPDCDHHAQTTTGASTCTSADGKPRPLPHFLRTRTGAETPVKYHCSIDRTLVARLYTQEDRDAGGTMLAESRCLSDATAPATPQVQHT